ncbi:hypothetical protein [Rhizobium bangladeshense]|uniref:hypothetical protein n=1 Tax=Rhizobium bangladeshense TaxID=1138189 RepID=UPI0012E7CDDE
MRQHRDSSRPTPAWRCSPRNRTAACRCRLSAAEAYDALSTDEQARRGTSELAGGTSELAGGTSKLAGG